MSDYSLRNFLKLGAMAGLGLAAGPKIWAAETVAVDFELVKREYVRLYNYIKSEGTKALSAGKRFGVVSAQVHNAVNSAVLGESMLAIVCWRLAMPNMAVEMAAHDNAFTSALKGQDELLEILKKEGPGASINFCMKVLREVYQGHVYQQEFPKKYDPDFKFESWQCTSSQGVMLGYNMVAADPLHDLFRPGMEIPELIEVYKKREPAMIEALDKISTAENTPGHFVSTNGGVHTRVIIDGLNKKPGNYIVGVNLTDGESGIHPEVMKKMRSEDKKSADFFDQRDAGLKDLHAVNIPMSPQLHPAQAMALVWMAAFEHMASPEIGFISKSTKELCVNELLKACPDVPGYSAGQKR